MSPVRLQAYRDATRLVGLLLVLVLLGLGAYAVTMDRRASAATLEAEQSMNLARAYSDFYWQLLELESIGNRFVVSPSESLLDEMNVGVEHILVLLDRLEEAGGEDDRAVAQFIRDEYMWVFPEVQLFFSSLLEGRPYYGEVPPSTITSELGELVLPRSQLQRQKSVEAISDLRTWQEQRVWTTVGVFAGGLGLAMLLVFVLRRTALQAARAQAALTALRRETLTDSLTGLGTHRALQELLRSERIGGNDALVLLDLDRFKEVNDVRGHAEGDQLLRRVAAILGHRFPGSAFRIGGDEFAVITDAGSAQADTEAVIKESRLALTDVTLSAGIAFWDVLSFDADLNFAQADAALRWAKRGERNRSVLYSDVADRVGGVHSARKSQAVRQVIADGQGVTAVFQPIWALSGELRGFEALSRFDPALGLGGPEEAFDVATQDGRTLELDRVCLDTIIASAGELPADAMLFMNLSPSSLVDRRFSPEALIERIERGGRSASEVVLEITERATVPLDILSDRIDQLRAARFRIALDDVGAGNAGLETLRRVTVDWIKIDQSITSRASSDFVARGVMRALLAFAGEIRATVVAEGIEDLETPEIVRGSQGYAARRTVEVVAQGYFLGHPMPASTRFAVPAHLDAPAA